MNPRHEMTALQRLLTILGTAGAATLMTLPVLAQSTTNNGVLNPNPGIFNEAPYNRSTTSTSGEVLNPNPSVFNEAPYNSTTPSAAPSAPTGQTSNRCTYIQGGIGGPIDTPAAQAVPSGQQGLASFSSSSDLAAVPGSTNSFPNQAESYANRRNQTPGIQSANPTIARAGVVTPADLGRSDALTRRQFDANNRNPAVAYRTNGPAATAGREAKVNLDAVNEINQSSVPLAANPIVSSPVSAAPLPAECVP